MLDLLERSAKPVALVSVVVLVMAGTSMGFGRATSAAPRSRQDAIADAWTVRGDSDLPSRCGFGPAMTHRALVTVSDSCDPGERRANLAVKQRNDCEQGDPYACESLHRLALEALGAQRRDLP